MALPEDIPPPPRLPTSTEAILRKLTAAADGSPLSLLRILGPEVPSDVDVYICERTLVALQVRQKAAEQGPQLLHEYSLDPESIAGPTKGGVYELQCLHSKHQLQVKVQPALGMAELLPGVKLESEAAAADLGRFLEKDLWTALGLYCLLNAFAADPARTSVPLVAGYDDSPKHIEWILEDQPKLEALCAKCPIFARSYGQPASFNLVATEPARGARTRGLLLKALLEVKVLIIRAVQTMRSPAGEALLSEAQLKDFEAFMLYLYGTWRGGPEEQHEGLAKSAARLRHLIGGGFVDAGGAAAVAVIPDLPTDPSRGVDTNAGPMGNGQSGDGALDRRELLPGMLRRAHEQLQEAARSLAEANALSEGQLRQEEEALAELCGRLSTAREEILPSSAEACSKEKRRRTA